MSDNLIADPAAASGTGGARALDSFNSVKTDLGAIGSEDFSFASLAIDGVVAGMDLLAFAANPLKEFIMAGFGWIIENVSWINEPFNDLFGDPAQIQANAQTWTNISAELAAAAEAFNGEMSAVDDWEGDAADAYREVAIAFSETMNSASGAAGSVSMGISGTGIVVATVRGLILELICDFCARGVMYLLSAAASAFFTFGGSLVAAAGTVIMDAGSTMAKVGYKLASAFDTLSNLLRKITKCKWAFGKLADAADAAASGMRTASRKVDFGSLRTGMNFQFSSARPPAFNPRPGYDDMANGLDWSNTNPLESNRFGDAVQAVDIGGGYPATAIKGGLSESDNANQAQEPSTDQANE